MLKAKKFLSIFLLILIIAGAFTGCNKDNNKSFQTMEDFEQANIGALTGSSFDLLAKEYFPEADKLYYINIMLAKKATVDIVYRYDAEEKLGNIINAQI